VGRDNEQGLRLARGPGCAGASSTCPSGLYPHPISSPTSPKPRSVIFSRGRRSDPSRARR